MQLEKIVNAADAGIHRGPGHRARRDSLLVTSCNFHIICTRKGSFQHNTKTHPPIPPQIAACKDVTALPPPRLSFLQSCTKNGRAIALSDASIGLLSDARLSIGNFISDAQPSVGKEDVAPAGHALRDILSSPT